MELLGFRNGFDGMSRVAVAEEGGSGKVHVAVGNSVRKSVELLTWAMHTFPKREICILHVHRPSPSIPTLLGNLPASQASGEIVSAYRMDERQQMRKLLFNYSTMCSHSNVKVSVIATEAPQVQRGIVDLVSKYGIRRLVIGADHQSHMKVKGASKTNYVAKYAHQFCEIWSVHKGKHVFKRDAI